MKRFFKVILILFAVIVALLIILACLLITPRKHIIFTEESVKRDYELGSKMTELVIDAMIDENGNFVRSAEVTIPQDYFNAFLRALVYNSTFQRTANDYYINLYTVPSALELQYYYDLPVCGNVPLRVRCQPVIRNGKFELIPQDLQVGHISIDSTQVKDAIAVQARNINQSHVGREVLAAVKDISITPEGDVTIRITPTKLIIDFLRDTKRVK